MSSLAGTAARTRKPQQRKKPAVATWYVQVGGNDVWWRVEAPAKAVGGRACKIPEEDVFDAFTEPNKHTAFPWSLEILGEDGATRHVNTAIGWKRVSNKRLRWVSMSAHFPEHQGVAIFTRPNLPQATLAKAMRLNGVRTIAETDDNYFSKSGQNLYLRQTGFSEQHRMVHARALASMDANIYSTKLLRDVYWKEFRQRFGKKGLPEMHVCQNHIDQKVWPERVERDGPVRVGFMGSNSHVWDVNLIYGAIKMAKDAGCETHFIGYNPANPDPNLPDEVIDEETGLKIELRTAKSIHYIEMWKEAVTKATRWIEPHEYHRAAMPLDIGLAPLRGDSFTLGKSDVKAIEYTISGAAVVCANIPVYNRRFWKHEVNCLMANSPEEYAFQTQRLIRDPKLRYELVTAAQEMVLNERGLKQMREEWSAAING